MLTQLTIQGLRGFQASQNIQFAQPNGQPGSGLTTIVGANNAGKSTVIEALRAMAQREPPSFTQGRRNLKGGDKIFLRLDENDHDNQPSGSTEIKSIRASTSECTLTANGNLPALTTRLLVLPSRRSFDPFFAKSETSRENYMIYAGFPTARTSSMSEFTRRLFSIEQHREDFNNVLKKVLDPVPDWAIDQMDNGQFFLKIKSNDGHHSSEGLGEGLISLLYIVDALYDSTPLHTIVIDEPELSLHPALQRRLFNLLLEYSSDRQIIISTHSPYMVPIGRLANGARLIRITSDKAGSRANHLSTDVGRKLEKLGANANNPHILGLDAREIFFIEDSIVLFEGQEDIVFLDQVEKSLGTELAAHKFGWGVGGAENMEVFVEVLRDLGYTKVAGILDGDKDPIRARLAADYPTFHFSCIPAKDIRTKKQVNARDKVDGLLDDKNEQVRPQFVEPMLELMRTINGYFGAVA